MQCPECKGTKRITVPTPPIGSSPYMTEQVRTCVKCGGTGEVSQKVFDEIQRAQEESAQLHDLELEETEANRADSEAEVKRKSKLTPEQLAAEQRENAEDATKRGRGVNRDYRVGTLTDEQLTAAQRSDTKSVTDRTDTQRETDNPATRQDESLPVDEEETSHLESGRPAGDLSDEYTDASDAEVEDDPEQPGKKRFLKKPAKTKGLRK